jgi:hypothetical protein
VSHFFVEADAYLEQNVFTKQKLGADFVISIPWIENHTTKHAARFVKPGYPKKILQLVLLGSGFAQNLHKADPKSYRTKCR